MSVRKSDRRGQVPNWIDHPWTQGDRLHWMQVVLASSPRDWSKYPHAIPGEDDPESWSIYILATCRTRAQALAKWEAFCFPGD